MTSTQSAVSEVETAVRETLSAHKSMYLATSGSDGPWVGGVFFAEVDLFTLVLVLEQRGRTLAAIRSNPTVAVVVSTGSPAAPFLQARATASVVEGPEEDAVRSALTAKVPEAAPFLATPVKAVRLAVPTWRVTDLAKGWLPGRNLANPA